ncbi:MAG: SGNH/GDSL hydrolase family protein [Winogradskyella sp.]
MLTAEDVTEDFEEEEEEEVIPNAYKILSLGDSYTIGQSVCETCRFPEQLKDSLISIFPIEDTFSLSVIAQTGWTTTSLKNAIINENPANDHDLVTLLIGVNNQFQGRPFSLYEAEFPELVTTAITLAKNDKNNVIVVSIPDYAFTPFGQGTGNPTNTSLEIDQYNVFAESYCDAQNITFVNITDITRQGLTNTALVASDGLHPSELAYTRFVQRLLPIAVEKIE